MWARVIIVTFVVLATAGIIYLLDTGGKRQADEEFRSAFGSVLPKSVEAKQALRPIVLQKLVQVRSELEQTEQHYEQLQTLLDHRSAHRTVKEATREVRRIEDIDAILRKKSELGNSLDRLCRKADENGFGVETRAAQCRYHREVGGADGPF